MPKLTAYLDTSSWNHLLGGSVPFFTKGIGGSDLCIPCYSTESIVELLGVSDERKRKALDAQLDTVCARHMETTSETDGGMPSGYTLTVRNPEQRTEIYEEMHRLSSVGSFGLGDFLQKAIGGISSMTNEDISARALRDLRHLLDFDTSDLPDDLAKMIEVEAAVMIDRARQTQMELLVQLNRQPEFQLHQLDKVRMNNFKVPGAVEQVMSLANQHEASAALVAEFLSSAPTIPQLRADAHLTIPTWEKVMRLAQLLFLLGYRREAKHEKDTEQARKDFSGGHADITHIANASFCSVFHTTDKHQAHVAAAVFDHLKVPTFVILYTPAENVETVLHAPASIQAIDE